LSQESGRPEAAGEVNDPPTDRPPTQS
jgi:hypothetical protein